MRTFLTLVVLLLLFAGLLGATHRWRSGQRREAALDALVIATATVAILLHLWS